jgi:hypothetical protein
MPSPDSLTKSSSAPIYRPGRISGTRLPPQIRPPPPRTISVRDPGFIESSRCLEDLPGRCSRIPRFALFAPVTIHPLQHTRTPMQPFAGLRRRFRAGSQGCSQTRNSGLNYLNPFGIPRIFERHPGQLIRIPSGIFPKVSVCTCSNLNRSRHGFIDRAEPTASPFGNGSRPPTPPPRKTDASPRQDWRR